MEISLLQTSCAVGVLYLRFSGLGEGVMNKSKLCENPLCWVLFALENRHLPSLSPTTWSRNVPC